MFRPPRKVWRDLTPAYRKRMSSKGLTSRNWGTKKGAELRKAARGHARTPERPQQAAKHPERFREYNARQVDLEQRVYTRKQRMWGDDVKFRTGRARNNIDTNPVTEKPTDRALMRRFLAMTDDEITALAARVGTLVAHKNYSMAEWAFMFYH